MSQIDTAIQATGQNTMTADEVREVRALAGKSPRLTSGEVVMTLAQIGQSISRLAESFDKIPTLNAASAIAEELKFVIDNANAIQVKAIRLLESNR